MQKQFWLNFCTLVFLFCLSSVSAVSCYQEQTNSSSVSDGTCGLNYSGSYTIYGTWSNPNNIFDANWNSFGTASASTSLITISYYKPSNLGSNYTQWMVKDNSGNVTLGLPSGCSIRNPVTLSLAYNSTCFSKDTLIKTLLGDKKISDVIVGDYVLSYDELTKTNTYSEVTETFFHPKNESNDLVIINKKFYVTTNHPIYLNGNWNESQNAKVGDNLLDYLGNNISITSISYDDKKEDTYNLEVANTHNYYAEGYLVHNKPVYFSWNCFNGVSYNVLRVGSLNYAYEEGIIWNGTNPSTDCWSKVGTFYVIPLYCQLNSLTVFS